MSSLYIHLDEQDRELRDGWCLTCAHNKGPTISGGTLNEGIGCICTSKEHIEASSKEAEGYTNDDGSLMVEVHIFRGETTYDVFECEHWEEGLGTPKLYGITDNPNYLYLAEMDSEKLKWVGTGRTADEAVKAIKDRWDKNMKYMLERFGQDPLYWDDFKEEYGETPEDAYGMWVRRLKLGKGYMEDGHEEEPETDG